MAYYVVSVGSNCGDRKGAVAKALEWLSENLSDFHASEIYETPPVGHQGSDYMNAVAAGECDMPLSRFERECKRYEVINGRDLFARLRHEVPVDIDVVIAEGKILRPEDFRRDFFQFGYKQICFVHHS